MNKITINECVYNIHPIYNLYAVSENGEILHICKNIKMKGNNNHTGYLVCNAKKCSRKSKPISIHRFIWECFNGVIPTNKVGDHINNDKTDNRLCNLQLLTQQENCLKSAKNRDYSFA